MSGAPDGGRISDSIPCAASGTLKLAKRRECPIQVIEYFKQTEQSGHS
jgi:hypothetical protein